MWLNYRGKALYLGLTETNTAGTPPPPLLPPISSSVWHESERTQPLVITGGSSERKLGVDGIAEYGRSWDALGHCNAWQLRPKEEICSYEWMGVFTLSLTAQQPNEWAGKSSWGSPPCSQQGWGCEGVGGSCMLILASMLNGWIPHEHATLSRTGPCGTRTWLCTQTGPLAPSQHATFKNVLDELTRRLNTSASLVDVRILIRKKNYSYFVLLGPRCYTATHH